MTPRISIIIPTLGSDPFLKAAIQSVLQNGILDLECIVVRGENKDAADESFFDADPRLVVEDFLSSNVSSLINRGLTRASGDIIGILNSDNKYEPDALVKVQKHFEQDAKSEVLYGQVHSLGVDDRLIRRICVYPPTLKRLAERECLQSSAVFYRKSLLERFGRLTNRWILGCTMNIGFGWHRLVFPSTAPVRF